eukprot:TRINITY_DN42959_c0_g1_i1.p1 TRINITY_DN42959_c0_g1~~TRINITY_DN42959_c0_g1_i1.p1  ORF type:complete len:2015 (-),score=334.00 TRINITY_DN42959_c0_g1_i1:98-5293(-)
MVNCETREAQNPISSTESAFSRCFGAAAIVVRQKRDVAQTSGGASLTKDGAAPRLAAHAPLGGKRAAPMPSSASESRAGGVATEDSDDKRRSIQALGTAFTILMSSWQGSKDVNARIGAMEMLGHLSLVIPKDQFLTNADSLLELLVNLVTRQSSAWSGVPPLRLLRGLCLFLQSCIDADSEILLLEKALQTLTSTLFAWIVASGPLQSLQGSVGIDSVQRQAEVLRCLEVLAEEFPTEVLDFLLAKVKGTRDEKLGSLLVLRHLIGSANWRPRSAAMIEGAQQLTIDTDPAVGLLLGELVAALAGADFLQDAGYVVEGKAVDTDGGGNQNAEDATCVAHVHVLLSFLISQTALTQTAEPEQSSYVAKFVAKSQPTDMLTCHEVRGRAGLVLGHLAGSLKPSVRLLLWPMLLQALVSPVMRAGLPVLCRAVSLIVADVRGSGEGSDRDMAELSHAFKAGSGKSTQPELILVWLLLCAHSPNDIPGLGLSVLKCLESLSPLLHRVLGEIWESPSKRLQTLCSYLEEYSGNRFDPEFWQSALSQEVHFFLSALPEHDDLPSRLVDIIGSLHMEVWRKDRDMSDLAELQKAALFNLTGVCLSHVGVANKIHTSLDFILSHCSDLIIETAVHRACARGLGITAQRHFELVLGVLGKWGKTDAATRRAGTIAQSLFGKSQAVQQAEHLRAMLALALGYCAVYAPSIELLQEHCCEHIMGPLHAALTQERSTPVLLNIVEAVRLASDAVRMSPESLAQRDPFLSRTERERSAGSFTTDPTICAKLSSQRDDLVRALLPFLETPSEQDDERKRTAFDELICPAISATSSLISLPLDFPSDLYASILEAGLQVLIFSIPNDTSAVMRQGVAGEDLLQGVEAGIAAQIQAAKCLIKSLLFHAHSWLGVSRLLQAVHAAGASCPVEFIRWTCTHLIDVLCTAAPILDVPQLQEEEKEEIHNDVGDWCECLALLLPRTGDSCKPVVLVAVKAVQQLLSRCEWTADVRLGLQEDRGVSSRSNFATPPVATDRSYSAERGEGCADFAPPSQQLVAALVARLPPTAIPPLVQHLMPSMHDADSRAALSGVDALYLILQACSEKLSGERATSLISTVFEEVERVSHSSVRQRVLSCIKVLALHHFETAVSELLETGPDFNTSILGALQVLAKEKALLLRLLNHFTDTLNNSDTGTQKSPNRQVLAATVALGHLFTVNDSSISLIVKKYFPQLFCTFLLRIGTTAEGLSAEQTATAFMNFLHASQNVSMAMALEGNRLSRVNRELYDEVISELAALFCRHHPGKREALLQFMQPFLARPFPGHRVATVSALSQLLASGVDGSLEGEVVTQLVRSVLRCAGDAHSTVRKQAMRGLGHFVLLWQQRSAGSLLAAKDGEGTGADTDEDLALGQVLPALCQALTDDCTSTQREAVLALQRACHVEELPAACRRLLLGAVRHVQPLLGAEDVGLRGASLDLLGRLCQLSGPPLEADFDFGQRAVHTANVTEGAANDGGGDGEGADGGNGVGGGKVGDEGQVGEGTTTSGTVAAGADRFGADGEFRDTLEVVLVDCVIHLEDTNGAVSLAAGRCLSRLVGALKIGSVAAAEAQELLQRREEEQMDFEQFIFPFIALVHRKQDSALAARRLEICRVHFAAGRREMTEGGSASPGHDGGVASGGAFSLSTCVAAGFVAAAFVRCFGNAEPRPSVLLCQVCRDLVDLINVEDSDFRAQVARILGFFDILSQGASLV